MAFNWSQTFEYNDMKELYELVIPKDDLWNPLILTKHPDKVNGFVARDNDGKVIACAVIANLNKSNATYIDCFAIVPEIRGNKLSYVAWNSFIEFLNEKYKQYNTNKLIIEVYLQNVAIWHKVMGIDVLNIDAIVTKSKLITPTLIMGKNIMSETEGVEVYSEWQEIEDLF
jgi:hypothetical protein